MAFSQDPSTYSQEERDVLLEATTEPIEIRCESRENGMYIRHRLYALKAAIVKRAGKIKILEIQKKFDEAGLLKTRFTKAAGGIGQLMMVFNKETFTLTVGHSSRVAPHREILQKALKARGITPSNERALDLERVGELALGNMGNMGTVEQARPRETMATNAPTDEAEEIFKDLGFKPK